MCLNSSDRDLDDDVLDLNLLYDNDIFKQCEEDEDEEEKNVC